jgi:hypothetical protein
MPEKQSVRARDGVADPHGCGNPLRSGISFLTFLISQQQFVLIHHQ